MDNKRENMASLSSKALPYVSAGISFVIAILAILGYGQEVQSVLALLIPVLATTAGGGLINEHIKAGVEKAKTLQDEGHLEAIIKRVLEANKATPTAPTTAEK
jgi:hypothetical protein